LLETERLLLRKPTLDDVGFATGYLADPEVMRFLGGPGGDPAAVVRRWVERWERSGLGYFVVVRRDDGAFVGRVGINVWDPVTWARAVDGVPELAWALDRSQWGLGYATEAAHAVRDWVDAPRLVSLISPENTRSEAVARRLGAVPGGAVDELEGGGPHVIWEHPR
jgi:RimJ/RimL family protein N-acetyltransferase